MSDSRGDRLGRALFVAAATLAAGALVLVVVLLLRGGDLANATDDVFPLLFAAAAVLALGGWWRDRRTSGAREAEHEQRRSETEAKRSEAESERDEAARARQEAEDRGQELESKLAERDQALAHERQLVQRMDRARRSEREWARELREQLGRLHQERGLLGHRPEDVRDLVLHTVRTLTDAEKAMMLSREDRDGDGRLDLVRHEGFKHDPADSAIAQRFAGEVLDRETIVREDSPDHPEDASPADREIENLAAFPIYIRDEFSGVIVCANRDGGFHEIDGGVLLALGDHAGAVLDNARLQGEMRGAYLATVRMLADAIEVKDPFLRIHSDEVSGYVAAVADRLEIPPRRREELVFASLLHDVGKIGISERILLKPGPLSPEEFSIVQLHPRIGCRLLEQVPTLASMAEAVLHHHERYDGDGYPSGIAGEEIPLEARIICVADCFSAMTSERPYREAMSAEEACAELERCAGTQFDPAVVKLFTQEVRRRPPAAPEATVPPDPEIESRRTEGEHVLGLGPVSITDSLTLLYSHRRFHDAVAAAANRAEVQSRPFAVVLIELTDLAGVNERQGYASGDAVLKAAARVVERAASRADGEGFRYGGPRLGVLLPRAEAEAAEMLAGELVAELAAQGIDARPGTAAWSEGDSGEAVLARARLALDVREIEPASGA